MSYNDYVIWHKHYPLLFNPGEKSESSQKTKNVRWPEFTELLRHERMQDLVRK